MRVFRILVPLLISGSVRSFSPSATGQQKPYPTQIHYRDGIEEVRKTWAQSSVEYYSKVMREERRRNLGQVPYTKAEEHEHHNEDFLNQAKKHYFALRKIKDGKPQHAELIYRRIIRELQAEEEDEEHCDHAQLAVTTLLLALHLQRNKADNYTQNTRSTFLNFFRRVTSGEQHNRPCACSAKVLQAFALFEMKQGNELKSYEIVQKAIQLDPELKPVLNWKQFRNAKARREAMCNKT